MKGPIIQMDLSTKQQSRLALLLVFAIVSFLGAQPPPEFPVIEKGPTGVHRLHLTEPMEKAVAAFVRVNPGFSAANCQSLGLADPACTEAYRSWEEIARSVKAEPQFPYAVWGDFNGDGVLDFVIPFFSRTNVNKFGWHTWELVVFQGSRVGSFRPVVAMKDTWGDCFDGMIFHPGRKQVEYWCRSAGGSFRWTGSAFVGKPMRGD